MKNDIKKYGDLIVGYAKENYRKCFREPSGYLKHRFIVRGSTYTDSLWDWDSWLTNIALRRVAPDGEISNYEKGCILNFLELMDDCGRMPIFVTPSICYLGRKLPDGEEKNNIHKPCIAQHTLFVTEQNGGDAEWIRDKFHLIERFISWYDDNAKHESGLYIWINDSAIGVDNDPCTFYRPRKSSASIYLNCFMYKELLAVARLAEMLGMPQKHDIYRVKRQMSLRTLFRLIARTSATAAFTAQT